MTREPERVSPYYAMVGPAADNVHWMGMVVYLALDEKGQETVMVQDAMKFDTEPEAEAWSRQAVKQWASN